LTSESTHEQQQAGLKACTPEDLAKLREAQCRVCRQVRLALHPGGARARGTGLTRQEIIATFERRLGHHADFERAECLRNIDRIAEIRLNDKFGVEPLLGNQVWDCAELLAQHSDAGYAELGQLTVTYLTDAHLTCQSQLVRWMRECGFDEVSVDAVGNVGRPL